jgi:molecular chaperone GrpE
MNSPFRGQPYPGEPENQAAQPGAEPTAVLPETAAQLVEMERLQQALTQAEERAKNHWEQYLRAVADVENVRRRAQKDIEAAHKFGIDKLASELLPVKDSLELAVENSDKADAQQLAAGSQATLKLLAKVFDKLNIVELNPLGEPFDPAKHEAMLAQPSNTAEPNSVLQVVQRGYELNGRLLRPARVIVSKAP